MYTSFKAAKNNNFHLWRESCLCKDDPNFWHVFSNNDISLTRSVYTIFSQVLNLRVDITLLDFAGNVIDASCIAAMTALSHFRRPDFIVNGEEVRFLRM